MELSKNLPDINDKILSWAKVSCLNHIGFATKTRVVCMDCGQKFPSELVNRKRAVCPHCGSKLKIAYSKCYTNTQHVYVAMAEINGEFQLIRNFEIDAKYKSGEPPFIIIKEILQHWILPDGTREVVSRNHCTRWYMDIWHGGLEIRNKKLKSRYDVYPEKFHPDSKFTSDCKRYGIGTKLQRITFLEAITNIPYNHKLETLLKAKQYHLLSYFINSSRGLDALWGSIKICLRNNYNVVNPQMWNDYIKLLEHYNKDLHNAYYVCPSNLKSAHDKYVKKRNKEYAVLERERTIRLRERENERRKKLIENMEANNIKYLHEKGKFFDIQFSDDLITVCVLKSIGEFREEGNNMHHCVFSNEYYNLQESLILSARIEDKPIETIEVDLTSLKISQCMGAHNQNTKYHDRIVSLVNRNIHLIRQKIAS